MENLNWKITIYMIVFLSSFVCFCFWAIFAFCLVISLGSEGHIGVIIPFGIDLLKAKPVPIIGILTIGLAIYFMYEIYRLEKK